MPSDEFGHAHAHKIFTRTRTQTQALRKNSVYKHSQKCKYCTHFHKFYRLQWFEGAGVGICEGLQRASTHTQISHTHSNHTHTYIYTYTHTTHLQSQHRKAVLI